MVYLSSSHACSVNHDLHAKMLGGLSEDTYLNDDNDRYALDMTSHN